MPRKQGSSVTRRNYAVPKPLHGETFYLDVPSKIRNNRLEEAIMVLGGTVERFLNKHVACVVTDRPAVLRTSPRFLPSRGQTMLQNAKPLESSISSSDVMRTAKNWKIPIKTFDDFKAWLVERKAVYKASDGEKKRKRKVRRLKGAFLKVEDRSRKYKPLVKEMKSWPQPNLDAKPGNGPFDGDKATRHSMSPRRKRLFRKATLKKGYCELCDMEYVGITKRHLGSKKHHSKANVPGKYSGVDKLINSGKSLRQFVEKVDRKLKLKARATATKQATQHPTAPHTITIRRSTRLIVASSRLFEGSTYFTYSLPHEKQAV